MKNFNRLVILALMGCSGTVWAYGSSSSSKACGKPKFTDYSPTENTEVAAGSSFSFMASSNTHSDSINVTVKGLSATVSVTPKSSGSFVVKGTLPATLKDTFARIAINAKAQNDCEGTGGWLIKIGS
ncbi:MAG: hypothetical protein Q8M94_22060 [Ignavibacteria bacterium]|nr:hypothetical protein [Ignavibacteria bacterium]